MNYFCKVFFAIFSLSFATSLSADSGCAQLSDDRDRLECYDSIYRSDQRAIVDPNIPYIQLVQLMRDSDGPTWVDLDMQPRRDGCDLRVFYLRKSGLYQDRLSFTVLKVVLEEIKRIESAFTTDAFDVVMERDVPAQIFSIIEPGNVNITPEFMAYRKAWYLSQEQDAFQNVNFINGGGIETTQSLRIHHTFPLEHQEIWGTFHDLVASCQGLSN